SLIVAAGANQSYFGNDHFEQWAPGMKSVDDALELRSRILGCFEQAEVTDDEEERRRLLTFIIVGAGPTGVEMAGQVAELAQHTLKNSSRRIDPATARVILLDAAPSVLPPFGTRLGNAARARLEKMGVEVQLNAMVTDVDYHGIEAKDPDGTLRRSDASCKIWSAGVQASPLGKVIAGQTGAQGDRAGRVQAAAGGPLRPRSSEHLCGGLHDEPRRPPRRRPGGDPGRQVRGQADHRRRGEGPGTGRAGAVQVLRQGVDGHRLAVQRRGEDGQARDP